MGLFQHCCEFSSVMSLHTFTVEDEHKTYIDNIQGKTLSKTPVYQYKCEQCSCLG